MDTPVIDDELELPAADGEDEEKPAIPEDVTTPDLHDAEGDLDDAEQGGTLDEIQKELDPFLSDGEEQKWLEGSEDADDHVAHDDASLHDAGGGSLLGDEDALGVEGEDFGLVEDASTTSLDQGEEGFEGEEDAIHGELPSLDADEEGEIEDDLG